MAREKREVEHMEQRVGEFEGDVARKRDEIVDLENKNK